MIITFANYVSIETCVKIAKHLFDSNSAKGQFV